MITESKLGTSENVVSVVLPSGVNTISGDAFTGYTELRSLTIQPGCVEICDGRIRTGKYLGALGGGISLMKVTIPGTCTSLGKCAFHGCSSLTALEIPSGVRSIGTSAFFGCSGLSHVTIPSSVKSIGDWAFHGCSGLTHVTIPSNMMRIGRYAFDGCSALTQLAIPANIAQIDGGCYESFRGVKSIEFVKLVGSPLNPAVVANVEPALAPSALIVSPVLAGQMFGHFPIVATAAEGRSPGTSGDPVVAPRGVGGRPPGSAAM